MKTEENLAIYFKRMNPKNEMHEKAKREPDEVSNRDLEEILKRTI